MLLLNSDDFAVEVQVILVSCSKHDCHHKIMASEDRMINEYGSVLFFVIQQKREE
jgi:hypothetical protein